MTAVATPIVGAKRSAAGNGDATLGLILVAPIVITMVALVFFPLAQTLWDSLHRINPMQASIRPSTSKVEPHITLCRAFMRAPDNSVRVVRTVMASSSRAGR